MLDKNHEKYINFLESVGHETGNYDLVEGIARGFIEAHALDEGILDSLRNGFSKVKDKVSNFLNDTPATPAAAAKPAEEPVKFNPNITEQKRNELMDYIRKEDERTKPSEKPVFDKACAFITKFLKSFGNRELNQIRTSNEFKNAQNRGKLMDTVINPTEEKKQFIQNNGYRNFCCSIDLGGMSLMEAVSATYGEYGEPQNKVLREKAVSTLERAMDIVKNYIKRHGIVDWLKYLSTPEYRDAYMNSGRLNPPRPVQKGGYN